MRLIDADALFDNLLRWIADMFIKTVNAAPTIAPPPNDQLTLEQLREMDGELVWLSYFAGGPSVCMLVDAEHRVCRGACGFAVFENLGRTWHA